MDRDLYLPVVPNYFFKRKISPLGLLDALVSLQNCAHCFFSAKNKLPVLKINKVVLF